MAGGRFRNIWQGTVFRSIKNLEFPTELNILYLLLLFGDIDTLKHFGSISLIGWFESRTPRSHRMFCGYVTKFNSLSHHTPRSAAAPCYRVSKPPTHVTSDRVSV
jgi:hypothetical protein